MNTPLKNGYLLKSKLPNFLLRVTDRILLFFCYFAKKKYNFAIDPKKVKRILLCNAAHLGDVIIATSVIGLIKQYYPDIEIGFLAGSWSKQIVDKHPLINRIHYFDHWHLNRSDLSLVRKLLSHVKTMRSAITEIKKSCYDVVIDLYPFFDNSIFLLWFSQIPVRVGYTSGGFWALLTHPKTWRLLEQHVAYYHLDLVRTIFSDLPGHPQLKPVITVKSQLNLNNVLPSLFCENGYIVCHPGSGDVLKNWSIANWVQLKKLLISSGYCLVFTGLGSLEKQEINCIIKNDCANCINLCGKLSWNEFVEVIAHAKCLVSVDSSAVHVAAAVDTASVIIFGGRTNFEHWQPLSQKTKVLFKNVECLPCYDKHGCEGMNCIKQLKSETVYDAVLSLF